MWIFILNDKKILNYINIKNTIKINFVFFKKTFRTIKFVKKGKNQKVLRREGERQMGVNVIKCVLCMSNMS